MRKLALLILALLTFNSLQAQEGTKIGVSFGPTFNSSSSEIDGKKEDGRNGIGTRIGIKFRKGVNENYGFQTGIALTTKAFGDKDDSLGKTVLSTVELPIGLSLRTNELGNDIYVSGFVGPTLDIYVSARSKTEDDNSDASEDYNSIGASVRFGTAVEKEYDFGMVSLGIFYNRGISDVSDSNSDERKVNYLSIEGSFYF